MKLLVLLALALILVSGCTAPTGNVIGVNESSDPVERDEPSPGITETGQAAASCAISEVICANGSYSRCDNQLVNGSCSTCSPACGSPPSSPPPASAPPANSSASPPANPPANPPAQNPAPPQPPACNLSCSGLCQTPDSISCACAMKSNCCGNGICESGEDYISCPAECARPAEPGNVILTEIMYNPVQNENYNEWVEVCNIGGSPLDMSGWTLCGKALLPGYVNRNDTATYNDTGTALANGTCALITDGGSGTEVYVNFAVAPSLALHTDASSICGGLKNTDNETVTLADTGGVVKDSLTYFGEWSAEGKTIAKNAGQWIESDPSPGSQ